MKGEGDSQGEPKYILPRASQDRAYLSSDFWLADEDPEEIIARDEATLSKLGMPSQAVQLSQVQGRVESNRSKRASLSRIPSRAGATKPTTGRCRPPACTTHTPVEHWSSTRPPSAA